MARFSAFIVARGFRFPPRSTVTTKPSSRKWETFFDSRRFKNCPAVWKWSDVGACAPEQLTLARRRGNLLHRPFAGSVDNVQNQPRADANVDIVVTCCVKQIILIITAGLVVAGCCSTENEIQHLSTSDLQLRRYELMYCLSMTRMSWDKQPWQSHAYDDVKDDLEEKEAIEREITRRGVTDYHWPPSVTYRYVHDHCHCQCWVATL